MSFTNGFNNGFGLVNGVMQQNRNNERQAMLDERNEERYREGLALQRERAEQAQANADRSFGLQETQFKLGRQDVQWNQDNAMLDREDAADQREIDNARIARSSALQNQANSQSIKLNTLKIKAAENKLEDDRIKGLVGSILAGTASEEDKQDFIENSGGYGKGIIKYREAHKKLKTVYERLTNEYAQLIEQGGVVNGTPMLESKLEEINQLMQSEAGRNTMNSAFFTSLSSRFKTDKNIEAIGFNKFVPAGINQNGEPIFFVHMDIKYKDGTIKTDTPATKGQTANGDDTMAVLTLSQIKGAVGEATTLSDMLTSDVNKNTHLANKYGLNSDNGEYKMSGGIMYNTKKGNPKQVGISKNQLSQRDKDLGYMKYVNATVENGGDAMSKPQWERLQGFGNHKSLLQTLQEQDAAN